jgi:hypothetical protein
LDWLTFHKGFAMKKIILIVALLMVALLATNPNENDFQRFVENALQDKLDKKDLPDNQVSELIEERIGKLAASFAKEIAVRHNYYVFSIYTVSMASDDFHYLGIAKFFVPLQSTQPGNL